jgi:LysM repeat protein
MRGMNQALLGVLAAIFSGAIVLGSLLLSLVEGGQALAILPARQATPTPPLMTLPPGAPTYTPSATPSVTPTPTAAPPANCPSVPPDWQAVVIQPDDSLSTIAARYGTSEQALRQGNCLDTITNQLSPGSTILVPVQPASPTVPPPTFTPTLRPTRTAQACGVPPGWVQYRVRSGDTLFGLSVRLGVPQAAIQNANCSLQGRTRLLAGEILWVPFVPLAPTLPPTWTRTLPPPTFTASPLPPTAAPTRTSPPPTRTAPPPTNTPLPTNTSLPPTVASTDTPLPSTATPLPPTDTPLPPTATPLPPTDTPLPPTATPLPSTDTPLPPTNTPVPPTNTPVPPSNTPLPPSDTPLPPSDTPQPASTSQPVAPTNTPLPTGNGSSFLASPSGGQPQFNASLRLAAPFIIRLSWVTLEVMN